MNDVERMIRSESRLVFLMLRKRKKKKEKVGCW